MYGQLLRRMRHPEAQARYAVVVPASAMSAVLRVPAWVRARLNLVVYGVELDGNVVAEPLGLA